MVGIIRLVGKRSLDEKSCDEEMSIRLMRRDEGDSGAVTRVHLCKGTASAPERDKGTE